MFRKTGRKVLKYQWKYPEYHYYTSDCISREGKIKKMKLTLNAWRPSWITGNIIHFSTVIIISVRSGKGDNRALQKFVELVQEGIQN